MDLAAQLEIVGRLLVAALLGAAIGLEREIHEHPAGMRTHLLVALGSAGFTVLSLTAFPAAGADPARVAAQIVAGIGFLGAGAILKEGATIRGLTTAASLWSVAAVGMAAGAGAWVVAITSTVLVVVSLWPLRIVTDRLVGRDQYRVRLALVTESHGLGRVVATITRARGAIAHLAATHLDSGRLQVEVELRARDAAAGAAIVAAVDDLEEVELVEVTAVGD